jgi:hypothetical protein
MTQRFILVWAECPYIQFMMALYYLHLFVVEVTNGRERGLPSLG